MTNLELKSKDSTLFARWAGPADYEIPVAPMLADAMLFLEGFTGAMLAAVGVTVLVGNLLISSALLIRGPAYVIELLTK